MDIDLSSDLVDGQLLIPLAEPVRVPQLNLSRLSLPSALLQEKVSASAIDPRGFLALDVAIDKLVICINYLGSLSFNLRPEVSGAAFNQINGNLFGLKPGAYENQPSTEFFWKYDGKSYGSRLVGPVAVDNIGEFLSAGLGAPKIVDSESGRLVFDLSWQDQPWKISRENITGEFELKLREGSFKNRRAAPAQTENTSAWSTSPTGCDVSSWTFSIRMAKISPQPTLMRP